MSSALGIPVPTRKILVLILYILGREKHSREISTAGKKNLILECSADKMNKPEGGYLRSGGQSVSFQGLTFDEK